MAFLKFCQKPSRATIKITALNNHDTDFSLQVPSTFFSFSVQLNYKKHPNLCRRPEPSERKKSSFESPRHNMRKQTEQKCKYRDKRERNVSPRCCDSHIKHSFTSTSSRTDVFFLRSFSSIDKSIHNQMINVSFISLRSILGSPFQFHHESSSKWQNVCSGRVR